MPHYVMLTRLTPESVKSPRDLRGLEKSVNERVRKECPQARWVTNYALRT